MVSMRWALALFATGCLVAAAVLAISFQDNITRFNLKPRTPFQTYSPPPPPAYGARGAWALWPDDSENTVADIFYVHSTTYSARRDWNGPLTDVSSNKTLREAAAPNEAGPFLHVGAVYAPRYRQATLYASFSSKYDSLAAYEVAYRDIETAFEHFLSQRNPETPIILVGYGQGGLHVLGLLQFFFAQNDELRDHLAAAYVIGNSTPLSLFDDALENIPPCETPQSVRCVISYVDIQPGFDDDVKRHTNRILAWRSNRRLQALGPTPLLCVNPLSWTRTHSLADPELHLGAASATGLRLGETPPAIARATSAQCMDGLLSVQAPRQKFLRRKHWFGDHWRPQDFNLFYHDLTANAARRVEILEGVLEEEANFLDPIEESVDLVVSPVNKVPN